MSGEDTRQEGGNRKNGRLQNPNTRLSFAF
jgi:hypothetical protein